MATVSTQGSFTQAFRPVSSPLPGGGVQVSMFHKLAWSFALAEIFVLFTRFFDLVATGYRIPAVVLTLLVVTALIDGAIIRAIPSSTATFLIAFVIWATPAFLLGIWRSGSVPFYLGLLQSLLLFLIIAGLITTVRQARAAMYTIGICSFIAALLSFGFGEYALGRLTLSAGSFSDPNEYAMSLLLGIPLWWLMASSSKSKILGKLPLLATVVIFQALLLTGSRGAFIGLIITLAFLLKGSPPFKILVLSATCVLATIVAYYSLPEYLQQRYFSIFSSSETVADERILSDYASADSRMELFKQSLAITGRHALFGVGPGNFPVALFEGAREEGKRAPWMVTHNTYTQISSENGLPGVIFFIGILISCLSAMNRLIRRTAPNGSSPRADIYSMARYWRLSLIALFSSVLFLSIGYSSMIYIMAAVSTGFYRAASLELQSITAPPVKPPPGSNPLRVSASVPPARRIGFTRYK